MRLVSCHIENFGKFHDYSIDFSEGFNAVCEENGWGKSTLAAFIKAMFYGFEGERKRSIEENERKRYKPWQGGVFGGQLVIEVQGKRYQISRIFKDKEANDEFELRAVETNLASADYSEKIGEELFLINSESFARTVYIGQSACGTSATDDINAKIGNLADNANDLNNFDSAYAKLTELLNAMTPNRVTGSLSKRKNEIAVCERLISDGRGIAGGIDAYQGQLLAEEERYSALKIRLKEAGEEQAKVSKLAADLAKKSEWERLQKVASERDDELKTAVRVFHGKIPASEEIKKEIFLCGDMDKASERVALYKTTDTEEKKLTEWNAAFSDGVPEDEEVERKIAEAATLQRLSRELDAARMSPEEKARLEELEPYYADETYRLSTVMENWSIRNNKKAAMPSAQAALATLRAAFVTQKKPAPKISILSILGIILVVLGLVTAVAASPAAGVLVALIGIVFTVIGFVGNRKPEQEPQSGISQEMEALQSAIDEDNAFIARVDAQTKEYLEAHGKLFEESFVMNTLQEIMAESLEYDALKKKKQKSIESHKETQMDALRQGIIDFLGRYHIVSSEESFSHDLYQLKTDCAGYQSLRDKKEKLEKAETEYCKYHGEIIRFLEDCGCEAKQDLRGQLDDMQDAVNSFVNLKKAQESAGEELRKFEETNDISVLREVEEDDNLPSLEELNQRMLELTEDMEASHSTIVHYHKLLEDLQEQYDEWEEKGVRLAELKEIQGREQAKYDHIFLARQKLSAAKETMTAKYADPILKGFGMYYSMLSGREADAFHIDANTNVTVDELGKQRDVIALSSGYRDMIGLCLRISLVDAMYREEKPMLIMDDPFANLDDEKIHGGRELVEKLAETYQILYFTCSDSRSFL
jgi:uncharacterized protein YhaN